MTAVLPVEDFLVSDIQSLDLEHARSQLARCRQELLTSRSHVEDLQGALGKTRSCLHETSVALHELRAAIYHANAPIVALDKTGHVMQFNLKAAEVFHVNCREAQGQDLAQWVTKEEAPRLEEVYRGTLAGRADLQTGVRLQCRDEDEPWHELLLCASPLKPFPPGVRASLRNEEAEHVGSLCGIGAPLHLESLTNAEVEGVLLVGQDLAGPRRERLEVELAMEDLTRLVKSFNAPIIGVDEHGVVSEWNRKAETLTGFTNAEAVGKSLVNSFVTDNYSDSIRTMINQVFAGQEISNYEFPLFTKGGQRRDILCSATARRDREEKVAGVIIVGQDITELRSESKMLANYVRICGAAVWSLRGNAMTGAVTDSKTKEVEHLISQQAQMDICDPRMVLWRATFVSILKTMCQNFWMRRKGAQGTAPQGQTPTTKVGSPGGTVFTTDFAYEFCFEAPNGSVKWYKVQGHLIQECSYDSQFEVTGSLQEVTSMLIDKVMGDRWQKWWNRMCHMVFDATLLVDTQEYRVLNAWGEEKVFGCKLQSHHPLLHLIKPEDTVSLKEAFNEVTFKGFERGRTLHLLRPGCDEEKPAQCFLLSADQENPNECMMGIRLQVSGAQEDNLWDVAKPNPVLTLEDLARLKSGLKRSHRRPSRANNLRRSLPHRSRSSDPHTSSHSLSSIPEDLHGEFEEMAELSDSRSEAADSGAEGTESLRSSSNSSKSSTGSASEAGVCNSSPARSASEEPVGTSPLAMGETVENPFRFGGRALGPRLLPNARAKGRAPGSSSPPPLLRNGLPNVRVGPAKVKLKWGGRIIEEALDLDSFNSVQALREKICSLTSVPPCRQTLILAGKRLPQPRGPPEVLAAEWSALRDSVKPGQALMLVGSIPPPGELLNMGMSLNESSTAAGTANTEAARASAPTSGPAQTLGPLLGNGGSNESLPGLATCPLPGNLADRSGATGAGASLEGQVGLSSGEGSGPERKEGAAPTTSEEVLLASSAEATQGEQKDAEEEEEEDDNKVEAECSGEVDGEDKGAEADESGGGGGGEGGEEEEEEAAEQQEGRDEGGLGGPENADNEVGKEEGLGLGLGLGLGDAKLLEERKEELVAGQEMPQQEVDQADEAGDEATQNEVPGEEEKGKKSKSHRKSEGERGEGKEKHSKSKISSSSKHKEKSEKHNGHKHKHSSPHQPLDLLTSTSQPSQPTPSASAPAALAPAMQTAATSLQQPPYPNTSGPSHLAPTNQGDHQPQEKKLEERKKNGVYR